MNLSVRHLAFAYRKDTPVLKDISFRLAPGELLSVLGPNGTGKTTLFRCILGHLPGYRGSITLGNEDIGGIPPREMAKRIAYIPQLHRPAFNYAVLDTVLMGIMGQRRAFDRPGKAERQSAMDALEKLGIGFLADRNYGDLSGGEQQLVLIARAIAQNARILVMDEPTSGLDFGNRYRVLERVKELSGQGYAVLLSTHDPQLALTFADRILALSGGTVLADGPSAETLTPELMRAIYRIETEVVDLGDGAVIRVKGTGR
ncbi:MAG: ABC transporter ATP-binding protein [Clostridia bacterium]|nr:ABC transporter ATP-binding protein [Clostridia bacterium]